MRGIISNVARFMATLGGLVLVGLVVLICVSVTGRGLNTLGHSDVLQTYFPAFADWVISTGVRPISGDFELVQAGIAFTVFAFFPLCQLRSGHATVGVFTDRLPARVNVWLIAFWEVVLAAVMVIIAWRLFVGFQVKLDNGETSLLLQYPLWWSFGASSMAAVVAAVVGAYCAIARVIDACTGSRHMPSGHEAGQ